MRLSHKWPQVRYLQDFLRGVGKITMYLKKITIEEVEGEGIEEFYVPHDDAEVIKTILNLMVGITKD